MIVLKFPAGDRSLPTPADLERLLTLPLTQLVVCGRSGSMFLHALLDGHPEILQIPHTFKFYDYLAAFKDFSELDGVSLARSFVEAPSHAPLFDSEMSVLLRGRLGTALDTRVLIDRELFASAMAATLPGTGHNARRILCAILLAHAWCTSKSVDSIRQIFVHIHHGDWLWPEAVEEDCNLQNGAHGGGLRSLTPDHLIITVRNPADQIRSLEQFIPKTNDITTGYGEWMERFLRLLVQDWLRIQLARASGLNTRVLRLEDLRTDLCGELMRLTAWLGVSYLPDVVTEPTAFGLPWWGDIYSSPSLTMNPPEPIMAPRPAHADHQFLYALTEAVIVEQGYPPLQKSWRCRYLPWWAASAPNRPWPTSSAWWSKAFRRRNSFLRALRRRHALSLASALRTQSYPTRGLT